MAIRSSALAEVGGYSTSRRNEDWDFCVKVVKRYLGKAVGMFKNSCVVGSHRGRDISTDGKRRGELIDGYYQSRGQIERGSEIHRSSTNMITELKQKDDYFLRELRGVYPYAGVNSEKLVEAYEDAKRMCFRRDGENRRLTISKVEKWLGDFEGMDNVGNKKVMELIEEMDKQRLIKNDDKDFLIQNLVLVDLAVEVLRMAEDGADSKEEKVQLAMMYLESFLPEYFQTPPIVMPDVAKAKPGDNVANYSYIPEAIYLTRVMVRELIIKAGISIN